MPLIDVRIPDELSPKSLNWLGSTVAQAIEAAKPIVLRGGADVFCEGLSLEALRSPASKRTAATEEFAEILITLRFAGVPVIALVEGPASGGGVGLVAVADWVVATEKAAFTLPELPLGLLPATILPLLAERLSSVQLRQFALRALPVDAREAQAMGLVDAVVDPLEVDKAIHREVRNLGRARARVVAELKRLASVPNLSASIRLGARRTAKDLSNPTIVGPIIRFLDGGEPPWSRT